MSGGGDKESIRARNARRRSSADVESDLEIPFAVAVSYDGEGSFHTSSAPSPSSSSSSSSKRKTTVSSSSAGNLKTGGLSLLPPVVLKDEGEGDVVERESGKVAKGWPAGLVNDVIKSFTRPPNDAGARSYLDKHAWPRGLQEGLLKSVRKIPIRFFIVDDSGSMSTNDGKKILRSGPGKAKVVSCTRWSELTDALHFHIELAEACQAPSEFRLLNGADPVIVGLGDDNGEGLVFAKEVLTESPAGQTPLCAHISCVVQAVKAMSKTLKGNGQRAAVIILTDGEATDGSVAEALKPLEELPVFMVVRLATDAPKVVRYWDEVDKELELEMDVLDDLVQDAQQVKTHNPWLRYGDELHRIREFGASGKELDLIDESPLGAEQMSILLSGFLNVKLPHPEADFPKFLDALKRASDAEAKVFDPLSQTFYPFIDFRELVKIYGGNQQRSTSCSIS